MMHLHLLGIALAASFLVRLLSRSHDSLRAQQPMIQQSWQNRWHRAWVVLVVPPLLLLTTAFSVVAMGYSTAHPWDGQLSYAVALCFVIAAIAVWLRLSWSAFRTWQEMHVYPMRPIQIGKRTALRQKQCRILDVPAVFSAQVGLWSSGLWSSELVVSQGLLDHLDDEHLDAVLAHEAGHDYYRDTFWFFWLGLLKRLTCWLPDSESLWQELLLLREMRADRWAARSVDTLVLAESLMSVMTAPLLPASVCAEFSCAAPHSRLAQRIDALLSIETALAQDCINSENSENTERQTKVDVMAEPASDWATALKIVPWEWIALSLMPLLIIPFHR
ncbi:MAG: Zn-dependent protease with chaperone function [Phormidesmis priestleyi Ana]|uniref:Zn-dependent protease with chaperone function n=1 Tax=Phormidesmis priestleyi Ana TaxID=1666911 RepID=A0A0P7ZHJ1_9CYAN|nr:MAG: Zn-dependent protease with chaperone function [Phormidesmis priestleyi Ana]